MTDGSNGDSDLLGSPLPGAIWLPHWRAQIEPRGSIDALVWKVANSPARPAKIATTLSFVSLPRPVPAGTIKRGKNLLRNRLQGRGSGGQPSHEELLAAFQTMGFQTQFRRQIPPGEEPFFGGAGALDDFIRLADQESEAIRAFASHWGPLGICKHLRPWMHSLTRRSLTSVETVCSPIGAASSQGREGWEPLYKWRDYSREASAIARDAIALRNSRERSQASLESLFGRVATWLELAAVPLVAYPQLDRETAQICGLRATFAVTGVFQILALQLLGMVAGGRRLAMCTHCGMPFALSGHREGKRRFCPLCVETKVPMRYAARDYRARQGKRRPRD